MERLVRLPAAALSFFFALQFLRAWLGLGVDDPLFWIRLGISMLMLELPVLVALGFVMGLLTTGKLRPPVRVLVLVALVVAVLGVGWGMTRLLPVGPQAVTGATALFACRLLSALVSSRRGVAYGLNVIGYGILLFLALSLATAVGWWPAAGISPELSDQVWPDVSRLSPGVWELHPHRALGASALYFLLTGLLELLRPPVSSGHAGREGE